MTILTHDHLKEILEYNSETGDFTWLIAARRRNLLGKIAGTTLVSGYRQIGVNGKLYLSHRLAWFYYYGVWPEEIDHIDLNPSNNRISNLRECTRSENGANKTVLQNSLTGFKGVFKNGKNWSASIKKNGKRIHLGTYTTPEEAQEVYYKAAVELYGEFARI